MSSSDSSHGPSIWAVSDGRAGNAAQVRAILAALAETRRWLQIGHIGGKGHRAEPIVLNPRIPWTWLPGANWPLPRQALPKAERDRLIGPWPTLWVAAGRRSAPYTAAVRRWSGDQTLTIQILDPKTDPEKFDLVVVPEHDHLIGANVIRTTGSPTHFTEDAIEDAGQAFADLADERGKSAVVILGGKSKAHTFTRETTKRLIEDLTTAAHSGWRLRITCSRRTPVSVVAKMRQFADEVGASFWANDGDGPNPYLAWLLYSDVAVVTEDSSNMLSDAAWHGLPIHIARLKGGAAKFDRLHQSLIDRGCARWFDQPLDQWEYTPLREAGRVADEIIEKLLERYPQPELATLDHTKTAAPSWF